MSQSINERGLELLKGFESCRLIAYLDTANPPVPTIGWGSTRGVHMGLVITQEEADIRLIQDLSEVENQVSHVVCAPLTSNQFSALVCFTFNVGIARLRASDLLIRLNTRQYSGAAHEFMRFIWAGGEPSDGLYWRRKKERALFLAPDSTTP